MASTLERREFERVAGGGALAGLVAGLFMALLLLATLAIKGQSFWLAFKGASVPFYGNRATLPGFDAGPVLLGGLAHFAISAGWGFLFAVICYGLSRQATLLAGALWGVVVWVGMHRVLLPILHLGAMTKGAPVGLAIAEHVLFGLVLAAAFLPFQRRVPERWRMPLLKARR